LKGWTHFGKNPRIVEADKLQWWFFLNRNFDQIISIIIAVSNELKCIICGKKESPEFKNFAGLGIHLRYHRTKTLNWWLDNIIQKSPQELEAMFV